MDINPRDYESERTRKVLAGILYMKKARNEYDRTKGAFGRLCSSPRDDYGVIVDVEETKKAMFAKREFERYIAEKGLNDDEDVKGMMKEICAMADSLAQEQADSICRALYSGSRTDIVDAVKDAEEDLRQKIEKKEITMPQLLEMKKRYYAIAEILDI